MIRPVLAEGEAPAARAAVCLTAGIFLGAWSVGAGSRAAALLAVSAAGLAVLDRLGRRRTAFRLAFVAFWLAGGFLLGRARIASPAELARAAFRRTSEPARMAAVVEGALADFWSGQPPRARTTLRAERLLLGGEWVPFPAEVVVFLSGQTPALPTADRGDRVRMAGHLELEDIPASTREVPLPWPRYRISVKSAQMVEPRGATLLTLLTLPNRFLFSRLPPAQGPAFERDVRGPLAALLLGRTSELDRGMVARYRRGGLYHLLVVSGLHVVLAAGLVGSALGMLGVGGKRRDAALLLSVFLFVLVGGANPPAIRAGLVVAVFLATRLLERPITSAQAIGLSALALFAGSPGQIFSVGTVLTFAAVCGITLLSKPIRARLPAEPEWLFSGLAVALAAECATAPVLFWRFNLVAAGAWLTAPLSIPLSGGLIGLGGALLALYATGLPAGLLAALFGLGSRSLEFLAERAAGCAFLRPTPELWAMCLAGTLLLAAGVGPTRLRPAAAILATGVFLAAALRPGARGPARGFSIEALDVGQGDAILLRWGNRAILVDGGGPFDLMAADFGRTRLVPKLLDRGVTRLDAVMLTHPHPDHALGLFAVLEELPVGELWRSAGEDEGDLYARLAVAAAARRVPVRVLTAGNVWERDGARVFVLQSGGPARKTDAVNNQSLVALFERDGRRALLTGDAGAPGGRGNARGARDRAGRRAQGRPSRKPHLDDPRPRGSGPAAPGAALLRPPQPLRAPRGGNAGHAPAILRAGSADRRALGHARGPAAGRHPPRLARRGGALSGDPRPILLVLFGETGAGKTGIAHEVALRRGGEIVSADAFAVYRGLDIGTAKPDAARRSEVPYHLIDVAEPEEPYSAGRWANAARAAVEDVVRRGRLPIVCGGSGFYLSALLEGLPPGEIRDERLREALFDWAGRRGAGAAHRFLAVNDPAAAARIPVANLKYTLRALEILLLTGAPASARLRAHETDGWSERFRVVRVGLRPDRAALSVRIQTRVRQMLDDGWGEEVQRLLGRGLPVESNSFQAIGYREVAEWVLGRISRQEAQERIVRATRGLAKRQRTWFARERDAHRVEPEEALDVILALVGGTGDRETR